MADDDEKVDDEAVEPIVDDGRGKAGKHLAGAPEIEAAMLQGQIALRRIEGDLHENKCTPNKSGMSTTNPPLVSPNSHVHVSIIQLIRGRFLEAS